MKSRTNLRGDIDDRVERWRQNLHPSDNRYSNLVQQVHELTAQIKQDGLPQTESVESNEASLSPGDELAVNGVFDLPLPRHNA
jgi:hypothetical protein